MWDSVLILIFRVLLIQILILILFPLCVPLDTNNYEDWSNYPNYNGNTLANIGRNIINALEAPSNLDYIEYGDNFTGIELSDCQGNKIDSLPHSNKYTILTYLSDSW